MAKRKAKTPKEPKVKSAEDIYDFSTAENNYNLDTKQPIVTFDMLNAEGKKVKVSFLTSIVPNEAWDAMDIKRPK